MLKQKDQMCWFLSVQIHDELLHRTGVVNHSEYVTLENQRPILVNGEIFENFFLSVSIIV